MPEYERVDHSHVVPAGYLRAFAVDDMLVMRLVGEAEGRLISVRNAAVRTAFYRRRRHDGTSIDDVEWSLSQLENQTLPILPRVRESWPLSGDEKGKLAFLFGYQLVRGPHWRAWYEDRTRNFVEESVRGEPRSPDGGLGTEEEIQDFEQELLGSTPRTVRMLSVGTKVSGLLGSMHWTLIEFHSPLLATSDHPVVPWPSDRSSQQPQQTSYDIGLFETLEFRVPISPHLAILMTWFDDEDPSTPTRGTREMAGNLNAFTVAQAERQWFHTPERVPPVATGDLLPISRTLLREYGPDAVRASRRRNLVQESIRAHSGKDLPQTTPMVIVSRKAESERT